MTKFILLNTLFLLFINTASSQEFINRMSTELCECFVNEGVSKPEEMVPCFDSMIERETPMLMKYFEVDTPAELELENILIKIGANLSKECDYIIPILGENYDKLETSIDPDVNLDCSNIKTGKFYYTQLNPVKQVMDTTFVTITESKYREEMNSTKTYSLLNIDWKNDCSFDLVFQESNDKFKNSLSKKGDKYSYQVLSIKENLIKMKLIWRTHVMYFDLIKIK